MEALFVSFTRETRSFQRMVYIAQLECQIHPRMSSEAHRDAAVSLVKMRRTQAGAQVGFYSTEILNLL